MSFINFQKHPASTCNYQLNSGPVRLHPHPGSIRTFLHNSVSFINLTLPATTMDYQFYSEYFKTNPHHTVSSSSLQTLPASTRDYQLHSGSVSTIHPHPVSTTYCPTLPASTMDSQLHSGSISNLHHHSVSSTYLQILPASIRD